MDRIVVIFLLGCLVLCHGHRHHDSKEADEKYDKSCECDDDGDDHHRRRHCDCSSDRTTWPYGIVIAAAAAVSATVVAGGCFVYHKKCKAKRTKTHPEQNVTYITVSELESNVKKALPPDNHWSKMPPQTLQTVPASAPPSYTTLPHYQPDSREDIKSPPPAYSLY